MTEEQYLALPEEKPYLEYVDGVVLQKPMADHLHRRIVLLLDHFLFIYIQQFGGDAGPEGRIRLPDRSGYRLPDTAYWVAGRFSGKDSVPSVAIEVRSEDQTAAELRRKCRVFRENGVDACWLIDPYARWVEVFDEGRDGARLDSGETLETAVMPGFSVSQVELFAVLDR